MGSETKDERRTCQWDFAVLGHCRFCEMSEVHPAPRQSHPKGHQIEWGCNWILGILVLSCLYTDQLHLEIKVIIYQGIRLSKVEEDMNAIVAQKEFIMNKLRYLLNQFSSLQLPQQQLQSQVITPQHNLQPTPSSTHHHQQMVSPQTQLSTPNQYPQQTPSSANSSFCL